MPIMQISHVVKVVDEDIDLQTKTFYSNCRNTDIYARFLAGGGKRSINPASLGMYIMEHDWLNTGEL